jgi:hypothetical protein
MNRQNPLKANGDLFSAQTIRCWRAKVPNISKSQGKPAVGMASEQASAMSNLRKNVSTNS